MTDNNKLEMPDLGKEKYNRLLMMLDWVLTEYAWQLNFEDETYVAYTHMDSGTTGIIPWLELCWGHLFIGIFGKGQSLRAAEMWQRWIQGIQHPIDFLYDHYEKKGTTKVTQDETIQVPININGL